MSVAVETGLQAPRIESAPKARSSLGREAIELAEKAGLMLDPWQQLVLDRAARKRPDGKWSAFEVGLVVPRQNGKGGVLEARELAGLFVFGERLIIHSAHQFDTSLEAFRRLEWLIEDTPELDEQVKRVSRAHGDEGIELKTGQRIRFRTRTKGGGRGFSGDCLILDEAMFLPESVHGTLLPVLSARPNPQVWYTGSAVDQEIHDAGVVLARIRERALQGDDPSLAYAEWSLEGDDPTDVDPAMLEDPEAWAQANPALGIRVSAEHVEYERRSLDPRSFAVERLGIGDWPPTDAETGPISMATWGGLSDASSPMADPVRFAFDVRPNRSKACIAVAGKRADGLLQVEIPKDGYRDGTGWVAQRLADLQAKWPTTGPVICEGSGPAASLLSELEEMGVEVEVINSKQHAQACGSIVDAVEQKAIRHLGSPELALAIKGAAQRTLGDAWAWSRKTSAVDISPLVAVTLALWGFRAFQPKPAAPFVEVL